jgi:protein-tyrosine phosphatase
MIDIHSHILPGLDDGAQSFEESLLMARMAEADGISKMVATPHLYRGSFVNNGLDVIEKKKDDLQSMILSEGIELELFYGTEVYVTHNLTEKVIKERESLVIDHGNFMMIEFPAGHIYSGVKDLFFEIMTEGIQPIIVHPERNRVFQHNPELLYELINMGSLCQANSGSFTGLYGREVRETVYRFLDLRYLHFLGSDCHNTRSLPPNLSQAREKIEETAGKAVALALVLNNPQAMLAGNEIPYIPSPLPPKKAKSLKIAFPRFFAKK